LEILLMACRFLKRGVEPSLDEIFADSVFQAVLQRDGLTAADVWSVIHWARQQIRRRPANLWCLRVVPSVPKRAERVALAQAPGHRRQAVR
jgi:hypothetical protein